MSIDKLDIEVIKRSGSEHERWLVGKIQPVRFLNGLLLIQLGLNHATPCRLRCRCHLCALFSAGAATPSSWPPYSSCDVGMHHHKITGLATPDSTRSLSDCCPETLWPHPTSNFAPQLHTHSLN